MLEESGAFDSMSENERNYAKYRISKYNYGIGTTYQLPTNQDPQHHEEEAENWFGDLDQAVRKWLNTAH
jgi:hypothetical protein